MVVTRSKSSSKVYWLQQPPISASARLSSAATIICMCLWFILNWLLRALVQTFVTVQTTQKLFFTTFVKLYLQDIAISLIALSYIKLHF